MDTQDPKQYLGLLAEYETPEELMAAAEKVRDGGYKKWDTHTPFPVHGIDEAMGIKPTILPWIVLGAGATGTFTALALQWFTNAFDYPFLISGKPMFSWVPSFPVTFELTVLFSGITTLLGMLALNRLPRLHNPLFDVKRFLRATQDRFFLALDATDPLFEDSSARAMLEGTGPAAIEEVPNNDANEQLPGWFWQLAIVLVFATFVPLGLIASAWRSTTEQAPIHIVGDMDFQESYRYGEEVPFFGNGQAMRDELPGTVASGHLDEDDAFFRGRDDRGQFLAEAPVAMTMDVLERGRERYNIYCMPCHAESGNGQGIVNARAVSLDTAGWLPPRDLTSQATVEQPDGQIFDVITNGFEWKAEEGTGKMAPYAAQILPEDRWAIVLYIRALQRAANASMEDVPADMRGEL